jgi:hypothetical protein
LENQDTDTTIEDVARRKVKGTWGGWRPGAGRKPTLKDPISFTGELEKADVDYLEAIASKRDVSVSSLVRNAVAAYVQRQKRR